MVQKSVVVNQSPYILRNGKTKMIFCANPICFEVQTFSSARISLNVSEIRLRLPSFALYIFSLLDDSFSKSKSRLPYEMKSCWEVKIKALRPDKDDKYKNAFGRITDLNRLLK